MGCEDTKVNKTQKDKGRKDKESKEGNGVKWVKSR